MFYQVSIAICLNTMAPKDCDTPPQIGSRAPIRSLGSARA